MREHIIFDVLRDFTVNSRRFNEPLKSLSIYRYMALSIKLNFSLIQNIKIVSFYPQRE